MTARGPLRYRRDMSSWRMFAVCAAAIVATGVAGAELTSVHVVAPPMFAALLVLLAAALSVDYFGLLRRHTGLNGTIVPRQAFASTALVDGDQAEIVHFVGGG